MTASPARRTRTPRQPSELERTFETQLRAAGLMNWRTEWMFHPVRRWQFDFAFPGHMLAVELDGGTWAQGRHTRGAGYASDCLKCAEAVLLGWRVLRFTGEQVRDGTALQYVEAALRQDGPLFGGGGK